MANKAYFELNDKELEQRFSKFQKKANLVLDHQDAQKERTETLAQLGEEILRNGDPRLKQAFQKFLRSEYKMQSLEKELKDYIQNDRPSET